MTKVIKLVDVPPQHLAILRATLITDRAQEKATDNIRTDVALAVSQLAEKYDLSFTDVHGKLGPDGVEYSLTMTLRSKP